MPECSKDFWRRRAVSKSSDPSDRSPMGQRRFAGDAPVLACHVLRVDVDVCKWCFVSDSLTVPPRAAFFCTALCVIQLKCCDVFTKEETNPLMDSFPLLKYFQQALLFRGANYSSSCCQKRCRKGSKETSC
jgi:hypothetical protein